MINTPRGIVAAIAKCTQCGAEFESFDGEYKKCPNCAPMTGQSFQKDTWSYMRSGVGFRLTAGFNLMRGPK